MNNLIVSIPLEEIKRVFFFLEKANALMHQPQRYQDQNQIDKFVSENYLELRDLYYKVVWNWLPAETQSEILDE